MSEHEWILSVLEDLGTYAQRNNLPALGMTIKQARRIAKHEICEAKEHCPSRRCVKSESFAPLQGQLRKT